MLDLDLTGIISDEEAQAAKKRMEQRLNKKKVKATAPLPERATCPASIWVTTAQVIPVHIVHCACGEHFETPAIGDNLLLRRENKRTKAIMELATPEGLIDQKLPIEHRFLHRNIPFCHKCKPQQALAVPEETTTNWPDGLEEH
jgi:hypothetical protein